MFEINNCTFIDCHSHPHDHKYQESGVAVEGVLGLLKNAGGATIAIGTDYENSRNAIDLALKHPHVYATIGIHPADNHLEIFDENIFEGLYTLGFTPSPLCEASQGEAGEFETINKVVAIGECGLDYFYFDKMNWTEKGTNEEEEKARQKDLFKKQIDYALSHDLPLVLHGRPRKNSMDAYRDMLDILEEYKKSPSTLLNTEEVFLKSPPTPLYKEGGSAHSKLRGHAHFFVGNTEIAQRF